jgi:hypothetical protein
MFPPADQTGAMRVHIWWLDRVHTISLPVRQTESHDGDDGGLTLANGYDYWESALTALV